MKKENEKGSLTVETAVLIPLITAVFLMLMNAFECLGTQQKLQRAVSETAMSFSVFSAFSGGTSDSHDAFTSVWLASNQKDQDHMWVLSHDYLMMEYFTEHRMGLEETVKEVLLSELASTESSLFWDLEEDPERFRGSLDCSGSRIGPDGSVTISAKIETGFIKNPFTGKYLLRRTLAAEASTGLWRY